MGAATCETFSATPSAFVRWPRSLFGGDADGYAVVPAASYGLSAAARAIQPTLKAGDRIVVLDEEFPSNVLPWRRVALETGAVVATVPTPADGDWTTATLAVIAQGARVAALVSLSLDQRRAAGSRRDRPGMPRGRCDPRPGRDPGAWCDAVRHGCRAA